MSSKKIWDTTGAGAAHFLLRVSYLSPEAATQALEPLAELSAKMRSTRL